MILKFLLSLTNLSFVLYEMNQVGMVRVVWFGVIEQRVAHASAGNKIRVFNLNLSQEYYSPRHEYL
jgi:hypothetical protein